MLTLSQRLSQQQKLSPQQIQYQKLLQLNTLALEQRIKTELELNPILEEEMELSQETDEKDKDKEEETTTDEIKDPDNEEFSLEDYMNDDDFDHEKVYRGSDEEQFHPLAPVRESLSEHLIEQLNMLNLDENLNRLGEEIIGNLDDGGYLKRSLGEILNELELFEHIKINPEEAENLLKRIQIFDPTIPGVLRVTASIIALSDIAVIEVRAETLARASDLCRHHFHGAFLELLVDRLTMANLRLSQLLADRNVSVF